MPPPLPYGPGWDNTTHSYPAAPTTGTASGAGTTPIPTPQGGVQNPFGAVPGAITVPNPAGDVGAQYPNLPATNAALSSDIYNKLQGFLSPSTLNSIQNRYGGNFGVTSGMPGSGLTWNNVYGNIIGASENQRQQGIQDYAAAIPAVAGTQTVSPALQTQIQEQNALDAAAPNPQMAQTFAQQLFNQYLMMMRGPGGGTGGGLRSPAGSTGISIPLSSPSDTQGLGFGFGTLGPYNDPSAGPASSGGSYSPPYVDTGSYYDMPSDMTDYSSYA